MLRHLGRSLALAAIVLAGATATVYSQDKKVALRVLVPQTDAKVTVNSKEVASSGLERKIATAVAGDEVTVSATWEPNGYTKMVRTRKLTIKDGKEVVVDLSRNDPKTPDDITVIYVPTPQDIVEKMCELGKVTKDDIVYDLGCGDGRMVITAVEKFGAKKGVGVDLDQDRVNDSIENAKKTKVSDKLSFRKGDVLKVDDLSDASVVLLYMGDDINLRLRPILQKTLKPGSRIVSHRFTMGDWVPEKTIHVKGMNQYDYTLHLWVVGSEKK